MEMVTLKSNSSTRKLQLLGSFTVKNQDKEITEDGVYTYDEGYTGLGKVTVNVVNNQDKEIVEDGTYTFDSGHTGLGSVTVNVLGQLTDFSEVGA